MSVAGYLRFLLTALRMAIRALGQRKLRSSLTILGIIIGPAVIITIGAVVGGYSTYIINQVTSLGQNNIMITPSSDYTLTQDDLDYFRSLPGVDKAEPFYLIQAKAKRGADDVNVYIYFIDVDLILESIGGLKIKEGSPPPEGDIIGALIGYKVAYDDSGQLVNGVGDVVSVKYYLSVKKGSPEVKSANVVVRGILDEYGGALFFSPDQTIFMQFDAGSRIFGLREWSGVLVRTVDPSHVKDFVQTVRDTYGEKVSVISFSAIADIVSSVTSAVSYVNQVAALSAIAVAVAGTTATMVTSVVERTKEIGVLKAIGYTNIHVVIMILSESLLMSIIAALTGTLLGIGGAFFFGSGGMTIRAGTQAFVLTAKPLFTPQLFMTAVGLTISVGILGGLLPAYMAAKVPPAVALRYE
jgi:putative ABC transport system permease protein